MGDVQFQIFEGFKSDQQRFVRYGRCLTWDLSFEERYLGSNLWNWNAIDDSLTVFDSLGMSQFSIPLTLRIWYRYKVLCA